MTKYIKDQQNNSEIIYVTDTKCRDEKTQTT